MLRALSRARDEPGGANRRGACRMLLDVPGSPAHECGFYTHAHSHDGHGAPAAGPTIALIELKTEAEVPNITEAAFLEQAQAAKENCPVSKALAATETTLSAKLVR